VRGYQWLLRPWLGNQCRFTLRCSDYALQALDEHGAVDGSYLAARRILRCNPWCAGGHDPVPSGPQWFARWFDRVFGRIEPRPNLRKPAPLAKSICVSSTSSSNSNVLPSKAR
jgi:putative membrane protein insertion efficiency factor